MVLIQFDSWWYSSSSIRAGLQVLFIGEYPKLYIYGGDQETKQEIDIREKSAEEIEKILLSAGCQYRQ